MRKLVQELRELRKEYIQASEENHLSVKTIKSLEIRFNIFEGFLLNLQIDNLNELTKENMFFFMEHLKRYPCRSGKKRALKPSSYNSYLGTVMGILVFAHEREYLKRDLSYYLAHREPPRKLPKRLLTEVQIKKLFSRLPKQTLYDKRDYVFLKLLYLTGMRISEAINLSIYDIDFNEKTILIRNAKGNKDRILPLGNYAERFIKWYLQKIRVHLMTKGHGDDNLFLNIGGTKQKIISVTRTVRLRFKEARIKGTAHSLRHSFATHLFKNGASILYIQRLLGHKDIKTTEVYTRVYPRDLIETVKNYHPRSTYAEPIIKLPIRRTAIKSSYLMKLKREGKTPDSSVYSLKKT